MHSQVTTLIVFPSLGTVSVVGTALVEGANGRVHAVPVPCGNDRPHAGGGVGLVRASHGPYARGPLLRGGTRMDHQRDSDWIDPLESSALSTYEEAQAQRPVCVEGHVTNEAGGDAPFVIRRRDVGAPSRG